MRCCQCGNEFETEVPGRILCGPCFGSAVQDEEIKVGDMVQPKKGDRYEYKVKEIKDGKALIEKDWGIVIPRWVPLDELTTDYHEVWT